MNESGTKTTDSAALVELAARLTDLGERIRTDVETGAAGLAAREAKAMDALVDHLRDRYDIASGVMDPPAGQPQENTA